MTVTRHPSHASTPQRSAVGRLADAIVETHLTLQDLRDGRTAIQAKGRWRPTTDAATTKTYESSEYDAAVCLYSTSVTAGWQVELRQHGYSYTLFDEPVHRDEAFRTARQEMDAIATLHGGDKHAIAR